MMDDVFKNIQILQKKFIYKYGITPNAVFIGHKEYYDMLDSNKVYDYVGMKDNRYFTTVFGIEFHRVDKENHLSVGVIVE